MTFDLSEVFTDKGKAEDGVWQPWDHGIEFLIGSTDSIRYKDSLARRTKPYRRMIRAGTITAAQNEDIAMQVMADSLLLGWRRSMGSESYENSIIINGSAVDYSRDAAYELLKSSAIIRDFIGDIAGNPELFCSEHLEDDAKN